MALISDQALVLDSMPFRDRHLLVALLMRTSGMVRGVLRRARGGKAPQAGAAQTLSLVQVTGRVSPRAELATFQRFELVTSSYPLARELDRAAAAAVCAELLLVFCPADEPAPRRFRLGVAVLEALLAGLSPALVVSYAQFWILALTGVLPEPAPGDLADTERALLASFRRSALGKLAVVVPHRLAGWLDQRVREEADRRLTALDYFRSLER